MPVERTDTYFSSPSDIPKCDRAVLPGELFARYVNDSLSIKGTGRLSGSPSHAHLLPCLRSRVDRQNGLFVQ